MQSLTLTLTPRSALGTKLKGDTLFGQLCWAICHRYGEKRLTELLQGYTSATPFAIFSDAMPSGYLPRPSLPANAVDWPNEDRKVSKKRSWLPLDNFHQPIRGWLTHCRLPSEVPGGEALAHPQPHNSLHRESNTTGNGFDPYTMEQYWYPRDTTVDIWVCFNSARITPTEISDVFADMGAMGFGRDASIGLGKFDVQRCEEQPLPLQPNANAWLTLAPCAPQGLAWDVTQCYYQPFTRFGRHGDKAVHTHPFKSPVLMADTGAVLTPKYYTSAPFTGQGLGGDGSLSKAITTTVHQGYAPVVGIHIPKPGAVS